MKFYAAGETVCRKLLGMPADITEWVVVGASHGDMLQAGFNQLQPGGSCYRHEQGGDIYQLARRQDRQSASGFVVTPANSLQDELETRSLTILAMAMDGETLLDPCNGQADIDDGRLRHVSPAFVSDAANLLLIALWSARLSHWGFSTAHGTWGLLKRMVNDGKLAELVPDQLAATTLQAMAADTPSAYFRLLQRCGALAVISPELDGQYQQGCSHASSDTPALMLELDSSRKQSDNVSHLLKQFYQGLGNDADTIMASLHLDKLFTSS